MSRKVDKDKIKVIYTKPEPYFAVSGEFACGATLNFLVLTPEEAEQLFDGLLAARAQERGNR